MQIRKLLRLFARSFGREGIIRKDTEDGEQHMQLCTMKNFSELTYPQLESFFLAHNMNTTSKSQLPTKGELKEAKDNTVRNRIRVAFECSMMTNKIKDVLLLDLSNQYKEEKEDFHAHLISLTNDKTVLPSLSTLLSVSLWLNYVIHFFDLERTAAATSSVSASDKEKVDL
jgi:hypothetical protein